MVTCSGGITQRVNQKQYGTVPINYRPHLDKTGHDDVYSVGLHPLDEEPLPLLQLDKVGVSEDGVDDVWLQPREPGEVVHDGGGVGGTEAARSTLQVLHLLLYSLEGRTHR